jgi:cell division protein FtsQ
VTDDWDPTELSGETDPMAGEGATLLAVDPRIAERRRGVAAALRRRRRRRTFVVGGVALAVLVLWGLSRTPLLDVDSVRVTGVANTSADDVLTASGIRPGDQLIDIDVDGAANAVESLPWIAHAEVHRSITGSVQIEVSERTPAAVAHDEAGAPVLVDGDGRVLALAEDPAVVAGMAVLHDVVAPAPGGSLGETAVPALDLLAALSPGLEARVSGVAVAADGRLSLTLRPQGTVLLGAPTDLDRKLAALVTVLSQVDQDQLGEINLTVPGLPAVRRV